MDKHYDPAKIEGKWYQWWTENGLFHGDADAAGEPYCIVIPPPNVTGILHMGHALNNTIQDIMARWRRMEGRNVVWLPGTDHAGIATQNVVERALKKENKTRDDLGRDAFVERVWTWREEYGGTIVNQLKRLGASCDWERERFTMDEGLNDAVTEVFVRLYNKGLIYKGNYIVNWCPRCHTALSDEESEHAPEAGKLYHIRYEVKQSAEGAPTHVTVATTRPETLLGDVAVAVNPGDARYEALRGGTLVLPILGRELVVIEDDFVDPEFGTGAVKVTPAHDPNDFDMGQRHDLTPINVMNGNGTMNDEAGPYAGLDRFECRRKIVADLDAQGLLEKVDDHSHAVGHCYRCDAVVEPRLSPQWFVRMKPLAEPAVEAVTSGKIQFVPERWTKVYLEWMTNIRDWCISRQIWWGHRIPVYTCESCDHEWAEKLSPTACPACGATAFEQDEDVLDTWFSSWLWPFSTFGWPEGGKDLTAFYPTHDLVTASEIIFFWVARMVMAGYEFMGDIPFRKVYIHGTVRDDSGRKMSKSLGNSIDPLDIIEEFSADALRFSLIMITATGQDVYISNDKFEIGRNFGTKLWNAARFIEMQSKGWERDWDAAGAPAFNPAHMRADDWHLLSKLQEAVRGCTESLERYRFNDASLAVYEFVWHQLCDWYLEYSKDTLYGEDEGRRKQVLDILYHALSVSLRLLHPFMPFVTEELWHGMGYAGADESIMVAPWPTAADPAAFEAWGGSPEVVRFVDDKHDLIRVARTLRADYGIVPTKRVDFMIKPGDPASAAILEEDLGSLKALMRAETITIDAAMEPQKAMPSAVGRLGMVMLSLDGLIDVAAETQRLTDQLAKTEGDLSRAAAKLDNDAFVSRAPAHVVERQRQRRDELKAESEKLKRLVATLSSLSA